jgi:hypothetical protein
MNVNKAGKYQPNMWRVWGVIVGLSVLLSLLLCYLDRS